MDTGTWGLYYNYTWWGNAIQTAPSVIGKPDFFGSQFEMLTSQQPNQVVNGDFATDSDWNKNGTITISGGTANFNNSASGNNVEQAVTLPSGKQYIATYEITSITEGKFSIYVGGVLSGNQNNQVGVYTEVFTSIGGNAVYVRARGTTTGSIDNVSVQLVRADNVEAVKCLADWIHETQILDV